VVKHLQYKSLQRSRRKYDNNTGTAGYILGKYVMRGTGSGRNRLRIVSIVAIWY
jgi:hypothetical protein